MMIDVEKVLKFEVGYSKWIRMFLISFSILGFFLSGWASNTYIQQDKYYLLFAVVLPLLLFCIIGAWYTFSFKINIFGTYIERRGLLKSSKLHFKDIDHVTLYENEITLRGVGIKIRITSDLQDHKKMINYLIPVLQKYQKVKVSGLKKMVEAYGSVNSEETK